MKTSCTLFLLLSFFWAIHNTAHPTEAEIKELTFRYDETYLKQVNKVKPPAKYGEEYVVRIINVEEKRPNWKFTLGGMEMESRISDSEPKHLQFYRRVDNKVIKGRTGAKAEGYKLDLGFTDDGRSVKLEEETPKIPLDSEGLPDEEGNSNGRSDVRLGLESLNRYDRRKNRVWLVFDKNLLPVGPFPTDVDDNDNIDIYIITAKEEAKKYSVEIAGEFADRGFTIEGSGVLTAETAFLTELANRLQAAEVKEEKPRYLGGYGPYKAGSITITLKKKGTNADPVSKSYPVSINANYFAGLRLGVGKSSIRFSDYRVETFADSDENSKKIKDISDEDGEPRYFLALTFYAWQWWRPRFWNGRDLAEGPTSGRSAFLDQINPFVGIGLESDPERGREFLVGLNFELARGLEISWGIHVARTSKLNGGFEPGNVFNPTEENVEPPVAEDWKVRYDFIGVSLDLRAAVQVLKGVLGSS